MNIESLHPKDGDIIVIIGAKDPLGTGRAIVEVIKRDRVRCGVLTLPEGATIETADEAYMLEHGWVRVVPGFAEPSGMAKA